MSNKTIRLRLSNEADQALKQLLATGDYTATQLMNNLLLDALRGKESENEDEGQDISV